MEVEFGFSGGQPFDFDIFPFHAGGPSRAERFERGLLRREARRKMDSRIRAAIAVRNLRFRIYSIEETWAEPRYRCPDAIVLDDVDAESRNHRVERMLQVNRTSQITLLRAPELQTISGVLHAFSTRRAEHNEFTLGPDASSNPAIALNRARFLAAAGMPGWPLLKLRQVHSGAVRIMKDTWAANEPLEGDAAITDRRGVALCVQTADCVPILISHREARCVAAVHAGWRGTAEGIARSAVSRLIEEYGIRASDLVAVIGPHNAVCCYEVGDDVVQAVDYPDAFLQRSEWAKPHFDQARANLYQLRQAGIPEAQIVVSNLCTQCRSDLFFSHRREGARAGRLLSIIGIAP